MAELEKLLCSDSRVEAVKKINAIIDNTGGDLNNKITNCLLEVPQNIKLELNNGTLTLKAGSVVIVPYGTEDTTAEFPKGSTFLNSNFKVYDTQFAGGKFFVWAELANDLSNNRTTTDTSQRMLLVYIQSNGGSYPDGATRNASGTSTSNSTLFYNTSTNKVEYLNSGVNTTNSLASLPIGLCKADGVNVYASIDQVFNGMGYIGSTVWVDKGVKGLIPNGRNEDGTLKNIELTTTEIKLRNDATNATNKKLVLYQNKNLGLGNGIISCKRYADRDTSVSYQLVEDINQTYVLNRTYIEPLCVIADITCDGTKVTGLTPKNTFRAVDYNDAVVKSDLSEVQVVVETYQSGTSWYRVWSDGFKEQGGCIDSVTDSILRTVTFVKEFTSAPVVIPICRHTVGEVGEVTTHLGAVTAKNFTCKIARLTGSGTDGGTINWYACGY